MPRPLPALATAVAALLGAVLLAPLDASADRPVRPPRFERPVPGPVVDPYRPPACRWCPGNRGIDLAAAPGEPVRAAEAGRITFAGVIGDDRYVVLAVGDLRVTYAFVAEAAVAEGDLVRRGQVVARAAGPLHVGVRRGSTYLDPTPFFTPRFGRPVLLAAGSA
jgi:murein DD-endopeptidase MepM/ murein hydrolase activator NlpD